MVAFQTSFIAADSDVNSPLDWVTFLTKRSHPSTVFVVKTIRRISGGWLNKWLRRSHLRSLPSDLQCGFTKRLGWGLADGSHVVDHPTFILTLGV